MSSLPPSLLVWLTRHTGFPARRLPAPAELLLLFAAAAEAEERQPGRHIRQIARKNHAEQASQRQLAENRRHAHFKSDNRTAV
ncbi:MAG: hypothetical protein R3F07_05430 [Opitutaceae bacterium]